MSDLLVKSVLCLFPLALGSMFVYGATSNADWIHQGRMLAGTAPERDTFARKSGRVLIFLMGAMFIFVAVVILIRV